jgi:hypothetical protein
MDFNKLLSTLDSLNKPKLTESVDADIKECGMDTTTPHNPPTMTVSLNANGLDDISSLMRLLVKVNPDMMPKDDKGPTLAADPNILTISNNHPEPLKMLPEPADLDGDEDGDLDNDEDEGMAVPMAAAGLGKVTSAGINAVSAVQDKMKDIGTGIVNQIDGEEETEEDLDGGFQSANTSNKDTKTFDTDKLVGKSNGIDKEKDMVKHSYKQGDNPMAMKDRDFKESIKLDLQQRLAEIKAR